MHVGRTLFANVRFGPESRENVRGQKEREQSNAPPWPSFPSEQTHQNISLLASHPVINTVNLFVGSWRRLRREIATVNSVIQSSTVRPFPHARFNQLDGV